ncbi:hypothetical protein EJ02DRAFT_226715 [Clathrospora elynae]|uniref:Amine oxidase domain-containing protein n=1 Tax=Clathrospora elynae TaxID=706981 RepID=A0A6A5SMC9_9PLEO|nr:hypothetical protein EJ02DRAFT_226715 [Clathrospora elynae]
MRAFAGGYYTNLKALYDYLGVKYRSQPFLFEFAKSRPESEGCNGPRDAPYFVHASNLHQLAARPSAINIIPYLVECMYLIASYTWFIICCSFIAPAQGETLQQYLERTWIPRRFVTYYLLPLVSGVTTCPHSALLAFPASDITEYKRRTHGAPHYTVSEGVRGVQQRLIEGVQFELNTTVTTVEPFEKGVRISWTRGSGSEAETRVDYFDRVILAVAPDVVGRIFEPLRHYMHRIPTAVVESIVHTDERVLAATDPKTTEHSAQLIHLHTTTGDTHTTESHHVQPCGAIVTTCPFSPLEPALVVQSARFTRVLRSSESQRIVNAIFGDGPALCADDKSVPLWRNGDDNIWLVGGWCWDGMVLLEGCVVSAMRVAGDFGVEVPWRHQ